jgi:hypothetical protein
MAAPSLVEVLSLNSLPVAAARPTPYPGPPVEVFLQ